MDFLKYQSLRQMIKYKGYKQFLVLIKHQSEDIRKGLIREYRAYYWLKKKYPSDRVSITSMLEDQDGKDIVIERNTKILYFAVSGPADLEEHLNCDYKIVVTDNRIYQKKTNKKGEIDGNNN